MPDDLYFPNSGSSSSTLIATSEYPGKLDTNGSLVEAKNKATTTLSSGISNADTTLNVADTSLFPNTGVLVCEDEVMTYSGKVFGQFVGIVRGFEGTAAVSHASGATVDLQITESSNNVKNNAIRALQFKVGTESSQPVAGTSLQGTGIGSSQWLPAREVLNGNRSYYVSATAGNDANDGRTTSTKKATIQSAVEAVAKLDCNGYNVTIFVDDGTYNERVDLRSPVGVASAEALSIIGNTTTPANCTVQGFRALNLTVTWNLYGFRTTNNISLPLVQAGGCAMTLSNWNFGAASSNASHLACNNGGQLRVLTAFTISGGGNSFMNALGDSFIDCQNRAVTVTNSPVFTTYANAQWLSYLYAFGQTWSAQITGKRYNISANSVLFVNSATPDTYMTLAGTTNGTTSTGGVII